jgi:hypothetical protein
MMTRVRSFAALAAFMVSAAAMVTASAANLGFLDKSPISYFSPEDMELMRSNATKVLDTAGEPAKQAWSNTKTGASGWAQVRGQFTTSDGTPCKRLRVVNKAKGLTSDATYTVCKHPDRGWAMNADAEPAK